MIKKPLIVLNFKTYSQSMGENAVKMAQYCEKVSNETGIEIVAVPQIPDIYRVANSVNIPVYSQHIDGADSGSFTGHINAECISLSGAKGTLINHSEKRLLLSDIDSAIDSARKSNLTTIVCTNNISVTSAASAFLPDFVAIEPPELIGSGIPVSKADPDIVLGSVNAVKKISPKVKVLCGAGISKGEDVAAALELGTVGVLLASGIIKAKNPLDALYELVSKC